MTHGDLRTLQLVELEILLEFDRICRKRGIRYTMIGGTLLGAARHKGFIPWDNDADVALLRSEYDRFVAALPEELDCDRFYFQDQNTTKGYRWGYGKLRRRGTSFIREGSENMPYEQGVFVDVFPLDFVPEHAFGQWMFDKIGFFYRKAAWSAVGKTHSRGAPERFVYSLLSLIPEKTLKSSFGKIVEWGNRRGTRFVRIMHMPLLRARGRVGLWRFRTEWLEDLREYEFEGYPLYGMADCDKPLGRMFGDYMTPVRFDQDIFTGQRLVPLEDIRVDERLKAHGNI